MWEEGPEVEYDRVKAGLQALLQAEQARRKQLEKAAKGSSDPAAAAAADGPPKPQRPATSPGGPRLGLLTFKGAHANPTPSSSYVSSYKARSSHGSSVH